MLDHIQGDARSENYAILFRVVGVIDGLESASKLNRLARVKHKDRTKRPSADDSVEDPVVPWQPSPTAKRQVICCGNLNDVADIKWRYALVQLKAAERCEIQALVLVVN